MRWPKIWSLLAAVVLGPTLAATEDLPDGLYAEFTTSHGIAVVQLLPRQAPLTVTNFVGLTEGSLATTDGTPYYTGLKWYRVVPGFVIQSGNPRHPDNGDTGYTFPDEFSPALHHGAAGVLSMANAGPETNSGEFFVTLAPQTRLDYLHSVFGRTTRGAEVWSQIKTNEPFSVKILRVGGDAQAFKADQAAFDALRAKTPGYHGEPQPGATAHFDDPDHLLPSDAPRARNFNYKLANFERTTGIKIVGRLFAAAPTAEEDEIAGAYMRTLAKKLGVDGRGALAVYFAADNDWRVWLGNDSTAAFFGREPAKGDLSEGAAFHDVKESFLSAALAQAETAFNTQQAAAPEGQPVSSAQRLKLQTDALLDGLIAKLTPR